MLKEDGFEAEDLAEETASVFVPSEISVPSTRNAEESCLYSYELNDAWIQLSIADADIKPISGEPGENGHLDLNISLSIQINDADDRFNLYLATGCDLVGSDCSGYVEPFTANVEGEIYLDLVENTTSGQKELDVTIPNPVISLQLPTANIQLECFAASILNGLNAVGLDIYQMVINSIKPRLEEEIYARLPELESTMEEGFNSVIIDQDFELQDALLNLKLSPSSLLITDEGIRFAVGGSS